MPNRQHTSTKRNGWKGGKTMIEELLATIIKALVILGLLAKLILAIFQL